MIHSRPLESKKAQGNEDEPPALVRTCVIHLEVLCLVLDNYLITRVFSFKGLFLDLYLIGSIPEVTCRRVTELCFKQDSVGGEFHWYVMYLLLIFVRHQHRIRKVCHLRFHPRR